jgi:hypothetical protein
MASSRFASSITRTFIARWAGGSSFDQTVSSRRSPTRREAYASTASFTGCSPGFTCSRKRVTCSGTGTSWVRTRLGSAFMVQATLSRIMPGTSQSTVASST